MEKVLITGCSQGLGLCTCIALARHGFEVVATVRKSSDTTLLREEIQKYHLEKNIQIAYLELNDLLKETKSLQGIIDAYDGFDIAIFNAGMLMPGLLENMSNEVIRNEIDTNLTSQMILAREIIKSMKAKGKGKMIFMSSLAARRSLPYLSVYGASKHGIEGLAEALYLELAPYHIEVYLIEPGFYPTGLWSHYQRGLDDYSKKLDKFSTSDKKFRDAKEVTFQILKICQNKKKRFRTVFGMSGFLQCLCKPFIYTKIGKKLYLRLLSRL